MHLPKTFNLCFQNQELWYMFSLCFQPRVFNLAIKIPGSRVSTFFLQSTNYESIIVILSEMCIVPKYYIVFCMIVVLLILKFLALLSFKTRRSFCIYVLLHSWRLARYHSNMFKLCAL